MILRGFFEFFRGCFRHNLGFLGLLTSFGRGFSSFFGPKLLRYYASHPTKPTKPRRAPGDRIPSGAPGGRRERSLPLGSEPRVEMKPHGGPPAVAMPSGSERSRRPPGAPDGDPVPGSPPRFCRFCRVRCVVSQEFWAKKLEKPLPKPVKHPRKPNCGQVHIPFDQVCPDVVGRVACVPPIKRL